MGTLDTPASALARQLFEGTGLALDAIAARVAVSRSTIRYHATKEGWRRSAEAGRRGRRAAVLPDAAEAARTPNEETAGGAPASADAPADQRQRLVRRLYRAFAQQVADLEARFAGGETGGEQQARTLGTLARTLEKLIGLERENGGEANEEPVDLDQLRQGLAERIRRLSGGGG